MEGCIFKWIRSTCFAKTDFLEKSLSHSWHLWALIFWCTSLRWEFKWFFWANDILHWSHSYGFSLRCNESICLFKWFLPINEAPQSLQLNFCGHFFIDDLFTFFPESFFDFFFSETFFSTLSRTFFLLRGTMTIFPALGSSRIFSNNSSVIAMVSMLSTDVSFRQFRSRFLGKPKIFCKFSMIFKESDSASQWISPSYKKFTKWLSSSFEQGQKTSMVPQQCSLVLDRISLKKLVWPNSSLWTLNLLPSLEYRMQSVDLFLR